MRADRIIAFAVFLAFGCEVEIETVPVPGSRAHQVNVSGCSTEGAVRELDKAATRVCGEHYGIRNIRTNNGCKHEAHAVVVCLDPPPAESYAQ